MTTLVRCERDIVILFGAGASHGAGHVQPQAPPLGADLYDALATQYPTEWGSESHLGRMWAAPLREDFERAMYEEVLPRVPSLSLLEWHRPVAAFFAGYRLDGGGCDMYSLLLLGLRTKRLLGRVMFGSLNYDCLIEQAMLELGLTADYMLEDALPQGSIPLAKIHGSCNFITADLFQSRAYLTNANASSIECSFTALPVPDLEDRLQARFSTYQPAFFPVLGLYSPNKPSIVAPVKLQSLRNILAERIRLATAVVLIGLKPNRRDPHLWEPIAQSRASKIVYVGGQTDYESLKTLQAKTVHAAETFEAGVTAVLNTLSG
jgi:hypothetical protein